MAYGYGVPERLFENNASVKDATCTIIPRSKDYKKLDLDLSESKKHYGDYGLDCSAALGGVQRSCSDYVFAYQGEFNPTVDVQVRENTQTKVKVTNPIVFSDGDDRARSVFEMIKNMLIYPYVDLEIQYYDLSSKNRDVHKTSQESKEALKQHKVGICCPTNNQYANSVELEGTVFLEPIIVKNIPGLIPTWTKPIIMAFHSGKDMKDLNLKGNG